MSKSIDSNKQFMIGNGLLAFGVFFIVFLLNQTMKESSVRLLINRFAEESMLRGVDNHTEEITPFNLNPKGSEVSVEKKNGKIFILETEGDGKSK